MMIRSAGEMDLSCADSLGRSGVFGCMRAQTLALGRIVNTQDAPVRYRAPREKAVYDRTNCHADFSGNLPHRYAMVAFAVVLESADTALCMRVRGPMCRFLSPMCMCECECALACSRVMVGDFSHVSVEEVVVARN